MIHVSCSPHDVHASPATHCSGCSPRFGEVMSLAATLAARLIEIRTSLADGEGRSTCGVPEATGHLLGSPPRDARGMRRQAAVGYETARKC
jgi:hypothetical protein